MPHVDIELEDNKQFISNIPRMFIEIPVFNANSVDPHQTPHFDLGIYCLPMSVLWDARHK